MRQTRHKSTQVALAYLRPADLWRNNVTERVFATATRTPRTESGGQGVSTIQGQFPRPGWISVT